MKKFALPLIMFALIIGCNVKKEEQGELPEVDVDVDSEAGELPEYDVDWANVDVGTTTETVEVPKVMVVMEKEEVEVPSVDVDMPGEDKTERSLVVQAEVSDKEHNLEIKEIRAVNKRLYVISELSELETDLGDKTMRIQDQVNLNAPDLDVVYLIVGKRADNVLNNQYRYIDSMDDLDPEIEGTKIIYSK